MARTLSGLTWWKPISLLGAALVCLCVSVGYVDILTHSRFEFISDHYDLIGSVGLIGALVCLISFIGWAKHLGRKGRITLALRVFLWPWAVFLIGYPIDGANIHGAAAPVLVSIIPASILSIVIFVMAAFAKANT